jgi:hypothetical protein
MLAVEGAVVTIDAMGRQRDIAWKIIDKKADYVLALKGNQSSLQEDIELFAPSRRQTASRPPKSPSLKPSMRTTAASRPEPKRSSTT